MKKMLLPCALEEIELTELGESLALHEEKLNRLEAEKKEVVGDLNEQIKSTKSKMSELAKAVRDKEIEREVDVKTIPDTNKWEMVTLRQDTGEEIDRREMTDRERMKHGQLSLVDDDPEEDGAAEGDATEEAKAEQEELDAEDEGDEEGEDEDDAEAAAG